MNITSAELALVAAMKELNWADKVSLLDDYTSIGACPSYLIGSYAKSPVNS